LVSPTQQRDEVLTISTNSFDVSRDYLAVGDDHGIVKILDIPTFRQLSSIAVCSASVSDVRVVPQRDAIVFACKEGSAGVADNLSKLQVRERLTTQNPASSISLSDDNRFAIILSNSSTAYVHDLERHLTSRYEGHAATLSYASVSTEGYPQILTGDINGTIRSWQIPPSDSYVVIQHSTRASRPAISPDGDLVVVGAADGAVSFARLSAHSSRTILAHTAQVEGVRFMANGRLLVSYGFDGRVVVWRSNDLSVARRFVEHHSRIEDLDLIDHDRTIVSVGDDGRLLAWDPEGTEIRTLFSTHLPLISVEALADDSLVATDAAGSIWHVATDRPSRQIREPNGDLVTIVRASLDGSLVAIGTENGHVSILDTQTWKPVQTIEMQGQLRQLAFAPDNSRIALASKARHVHLAHLRGSDTERWNDTSLDVRNISFSPDGQILAIVCANGGIWFYSFENDTWKYFQDHFASTSFGRFSSDGRLFISTDINGAAVMRAIGPPTLVPP
jgi:WD40 repeat protein